MKVDGLGVIMAIILLPIILVVTYYIQLQVDTIARENSYNTKLLNATYDAMSAFELNTANEEQSSVADTMRSIILASNNTFFNTLASNLGMSNASQENLRPYVPAILYTLYDGYYIYSPAETAVVGEKLEKSDEHPDLISSVDYLKVGDDGVWYNSGDEYKYGVATVLPDGTRQQSIMILDEKGKYKDKENFSDYGMVLYKEKESGTVNDWKENCYTTNRNNAVTKTDYILKPYTEYSARYVKGNKDVTINYTLDNYINIEGKIGEVYYTKSGYLIKQGLVQEYNGTSLNGDTSGISAEDLKNEILGIKGKNSAKDDVSVTLKINNSDYNISANFQTIKDGLGYFGYDVNNIEEAEDYLKKAIEKYELELDPSRKSFYLINIQNVEYEIQKYKAIAYYASSAVFSNWVYTNLGDLQYQDIQDSIDKMGGNTLTSKTEDFYYNFAGNSTSIFNPGEDPEKSDSAFNSHRIEVIKNSIKYNLNQSISAYAKMKGDSNKYSMPVLTDTEWDNILNKISIVTFMQGWDCGLDIYNNYEIAYSTNNELTVTPSEIYYVPKDNFNDENSDYHRIDCPNLENNVTDYIAFKSNEIKYDKLKGADGKYKYDHKNLACYTCINNNNYESEFEDEVISYYDRINSLDNKKKLAGYIGLGAMRQGTYKTNALTVSEGYCIKNIRKTLKNGDQPAFNEDVKQGIKKIELTFSQATYMPYPEINNYIVLNINGERKSIPVSNPYTVVIENPTNLSIFIDTNNDDGTEDGYGNRKVILESIKYIYK